MNKMIIAFVTVILISCTNTKPTTDVRFHGMWKLTCFEYFDHQTGVWIIDSTRIGYSGFIMYDGEAHMSVQITPGEYKNLNGQMNIDSLNYDELKNLAKSYSTNYSYFANYTLSGNEVQHHIFSASDPGLCGKTLKRNYEFSKDTLYLIPVVRNNLRKNRLKWIRI